MIFLIYIYHIYLFNQVKINMINIYLRLNNVSLADILQIRRKECSGIFPISKVIGTIP